MENTCRLKEAQDILIKHKRPICIIVFCPPKVGSTTLVTSLRMSLGKYANVLHIHDEHMIGVLTGIHDITVNDLINYISLTEESLFIIDVYRTPIERKMSEYFDKLTFHFNNSEENIGKYNIQILIDRFNKLFPYIATSEHYLDKYNLDNPIPFNFETKYTLQKINNIQYLKLRLTDINVWPTILSAVFNARVVIVNDHLTSNKFLGNKYAEFKNKYRLPSNFYDQLVTDKNLLFYFDNIERTNYLDTYERIIDNAAVPFTQAEYKVYLEITLRNQFYTVIEKDHYIDNGCSCNACCVKRKELYNKALKGETITEKIIHETCVLNMNKRITRSKRRNSGSTFKMNLLKGKYMNV
jgi:hypothetical protein